MNEKSNKAVISIGRSVANINKQIELLRSEYPEASIYVENGDSVNVMKGPTHTNDNAINPMYDNVIICYTLTNAECGAW